jgi:hypothetical protein
VVVSQDDASYRWMRWSYFDDDALNPGVPFEEDGTADDGGLAVARDVEARDLWAKRYYDVATAIPVVHGGASLRRVRRVRM